MRVLVTTTQIPFLHGGAERLGQGLVQALQAEGHQAEIVAIPFNCNPPERIAEHMLACSLLDITESCSEKVDRVIGLKFPAYLIPHPNKVLWLLHQHRQAYELWDGPFAGMGGALDGDIVRDAVRQSDCLLNEQARHVYTISQTVSDRLWKYNAVTSTPLYPPPLHAEKYYTLPAEDYIFFPSRLAASKRQGLVLEALTFTSAPVKVCFAGEPDTGVDEKQFLDIVDDLEIGDRVTWLRSVNDEQMREAYAKSLAVVYTPYEEDLGFVTMEAMLSSKSVITCSDSGGPLEFVRHEYNGLITDSAPEALATALDLVWADRHQAAAWGRAARQCYDDRDISWHNVVRSLLT